MAVPYSKEMQWFIGGLVLAVVAGLLRRILRMGSMDKASRSSVAPLREELNAVYHPFAHAIETHTTILGITLNDAFGERDAARHEMAWNALRLARGEWERLRELVVGLLNILSKFVPSANVVVPVRRVAAGHFKSRAVRDNLGLYEFLDQIVFGSKPRFILRLRLLIRSCASLSKEFKRVCNEGALTFDSSDELWKRLDYEFHDFDLIAKETLIAFRTLLVCLSAEQSQELALDLQVLLERGMRVFVSPPRV